MNSKQSTSIVFLGTSAFAVPSLELLAKNPAFSVLAVVTQPDRPAGRKQLLTPPPVKTAAEKLKLMVLQPESFNAEQATIAKDLPRPDFLVVVSYGQILSPEVLSWPRVAAVNVHASLLPLLRGASPIQHALLQGMSETGVTVQRMASKLDAGPILSQKAMSIGPRETFSSLHDALAVLGANLLEETLSHPLKPIEQDEAKATSCPKLKKSDGEADPNTMKAEDIDRMVRALTPWPGVVIQENKILGAELSPAPESFPLPCAEHTVLYVTRIQPSGKKPMNGEAFAHGRSFPLIV